MKLYSRLLAAGLFSLLTGCGSIMATFEADPITDDPGERTIAQQVLDQSIETKAVVNIRAANDAFDDAKFTVVAYNGYALICGQVPSKDLISEAADILREITGVRRIYNELTESPNSTAEADATDAWLTTKVKTALLAHSDTPSLRVKVVTENSIVYLMGLLTPEEAQRVKEVAAEVSDVKKIVGLFELI
jgi:osmotically-inducible protein OsmY